MSRLYTHAIEHGIVSQNPTLNLGKFYRNAKVKHEEIQPLTPPRAVRLLKAAQKRGWQPYALMLTALHTGMRSAELAGLQWGDIDWEEKCALVRRAFVEGSVTSTKAGKFRRVDLSDEALTVLRRLRSWRQQEYLKDGNAEIPEWIFCSGSGRPIDMRTFKRRHFKKALKAANLAAIRFHDLRHTFASLLIGQGESLAYVKEQLGHSTIRMTVDIYCHLIPGSNRQAVNRLPTVHSGVELESAEAVQESAATQRADSIQPRLSPLADCLPHPPDLGSAEGLRR